MTSDAQKRASAKWDKANNKKYLIKLNKNYDADIIQLLEQQPNKQGFIKGLLREYLKNK